MSKEIYISSTPHETRLAIVENDALTEIYYERENEYTLAGSIYNGKVTRVLPGMQSSFVEIGLERDAFLYITDFLEEAPDSAEFETSSIGEGRQESREPRESREAQLPRLEGSAEVASPRGDGQRTDGRGERNGGDREGRGGRGRRGRGDRPDRSGDGGARHDRPVPGEARRLDAGGEPRPQALQSPEDQSSQPLVTSGALDSNDLGEGAPGADGSRRWRGRRGRRRGRGPGVAGAPQPGEAQDSVVPQEEEPAFPLYPEEAESELVEASRIFEGAQSASEVHAAPAASETTYNESRREGRGNREGRDRGGRDRNRGRGDRADRGGRQDRSTQDAAPPRAPQGFTPSQSFPGVEETLPEPTGEPTILPGESLSKYRKGEAAARGAEGTSQTVAAPAPSTEFRVAAGWDGGSILPGESLSRHRGSSRGQDALRVAATAPVREQAAPRYLAASPVETTRAEVVEEKDGLSVSVTPETQPEVALAAHPEQVPENEIEHEAEPVPYEPVEASVSYRVDPIAPLEYRQSGSVADPIERQAEETEAAAEIEHQRVSTRESALPEESSVQAESTESAEGSFGHTHLLTPEPAVPVAPLVSHTAEGAAAEPRAPAFFGVAEPYGSGVEPITGTPLPGHDITMLSASGEMFSEPPVTDVVAAAAAPQEQPQPTSPMHHETAIVEETELDDEPARAFDAAEDESSTQVFSPGMGDLEEELIEDDEYDLGALHAAHSLDNDDTDEETLEGAADLGTMLREMSIDQITRSASGPELEEDDFEEDFLEESEEMEGLREESNLDGAVYGDPDAEEAEEYARTAEATGDFSTEFKEPAPRNAEGGSSNERRSGSGGGRDRDARRSGRDRDRRGGDSSGRARNTGGSGDRDRGRSGRSGRGSMQTTNLPAISELLKPGQEILVQIAKEPMAKKGARITSHIALPGRFLVFMPTVNHTGVSRKIESDGERRRLKEILLSEKGEAAGGFIVRTAAAGASEEELRSDLRFLLNLWADIKQRSESSKSPALIYHDLNLVERILRDQVTDTFSAIWVDTETEYERVLRFLQRFQPSLIRRVKLYLKETPLFEQFGITEEINKALRSKVWLKSGGSIVINQTEALVAIDINTGKFVGKTARLEDTIVKTNLDAIPEIVRQIRLRDLGGIIIIDFIDMDERKNRNRVMAALEEELKSDRAPSKVLQFNDFGLVAITRKRVKQSLERTLSTTCNVCTGTGMVKSPVTVCNDIYIEMRKMYKLLDKGDVMLRVHPDVVKQLKSPGTKWLQEMEEISGKTLLVKSDPSLHPEQFDIH